jgi:hypothetical protein
MSKAYGGAQEVMRDTSFVNKEGNLVLLLPAVYSILEGIPITPL